MNPQLAKELRGILLPWCVAVATAILISLANFLIVVRVIEGGDFVNFILALVVFSFFSSLLAVAAFPFGAEFQHRTLPLLLSQPIRRSLIWRHKLIAASLGIGLALLVFVLAGIAAEKGARAATKSSALVTTPIAPAVEPTTEPSVPGGMSREQAETYQRRYGIRPRVQSTQYQSRSPSPAEGVISVWEICLTAAALLLPTLGSVTYWTLLARSTLGGMVFTAFAQLIVFGLLAFVTDSPSAGPPLLMIPGIIFGAIFFMLSWRKFARFELSQVSLDASVGAKSLTARPSRLACLRCRSSSGLLNLIRKEIHLQKPLFTIAAILCVLWVLSYIFLLLHPFRTTFPEIVFALTIGFYIPLISFLAGSVSLGEEKNLAIVGWHLTFPVSIWRQWAVKLAVGLGVWILLGLLLPFALIQLGMIVDGTRMIKGLEIESWLGISLFMAGVYALSFWAMTLFTGTVRAVIGSLVAVLVLCGVAAFAYWLMAELVFPQPLVRTLLSYDSHWAEAVGWVLLGASTVVLAVVQSLLQFRRLQTSSKTVAKYFGSLAIFIFLATLGYFCVAPFTQFAPAIYLLAFLLLLIIVRRKLAPTPQRVASWSQ